MDELEALRDDLDVVDAQLMELAARRMRIVERIAWVKAGSGSALFDRKRERAVLDRARRKAMAEGVPADVGERLVHVLLEASHREQANRLTAQRSEAPRRVLVVGGEGEMGQLFARAFASRGHAVDTLEKDDGRDRAAAVRAADVVLVAVDMAQAESVTRSLAAHLRPDALLCDINSLKQRVCQVYEQMDQGEGIGLHPMFGGSVGSLRRQKMVVCRVRSGPLTEWLLREMNALGLDVMETDPATHDKMMGVVQVLLHFRTVVMGEALRRAGVPVEQTLAYTSPIYRLELSVVARLFAQDPELYASILLDNPHGQDVRRHFFEAAATVEQAIAAGDRDRFREVFEGVGRWFGGFSDEAMRTSDALIDFLVSRA